MSDARVSTRPSMASPPAAAKPRALAFSGRTLFMVGAAVVLAAGGAWYIASPKASESTDAAYIQADSSVIAPKVRGLVSEVLVAHNQSVHKGDPLVRIDAEEFDTRAAAAAADVQTAEAGVASARAALVSLDAEERLAASNIRAAETSIRSADAQSSRADADRKRYEALVASGAVAKRDADAYQAAAITAKSEADHSRAALDVSRNAAGVVRARRATLRAALAEAEAALARARAALALARQDQGHTLVRSPIDGVVADRQVGVGDYVQPGTRILTVEPVSDLYVTANFKETQTGRMTVGQPARIKVDALPGVVLKGHVDSLAPGTGSQFSLLPFEPGTGNFTKVVQRVPVRIRFDPGQPALGRLRPGLSTNVSVSLREQGS
jgi:membrane fusion protein, multidrug efflux system